MHFWVNKIHSNDKLKIIGLVITWGQVFEKLPTRKKMFCSTKASWKWDPAYHTFNSILKNDQGSELKYIRCVVCEIWSRYCSVLKIYVEEENVYDEFHNQIDCSRPNAAFLWFMI